MRGCVYLCRGRIIMYEDSRMYLRYVRDVSVGIRVLRGFMQFVVHGTPAPRAF